MNGDALILSMDYQETGEILTVLIGEEKRRREREREVGKRKIRDRNHKQNERSDGKGKVRSSPMGIEKVESFCFLFSFSFLN